MPKQSKTAAILINGAERRTRMLDLRKMGLNYKQIAAEVGTTPQYCHKAVTQELARLNAERAESASEVTRLELERLDDLYRHAYLRARANDQHALQNCLRIMARRARLLGLDAPDKHELTLPNDYDQVKQRFDRLVEKRAAELAGDGSTDNSGA